MTNKTTKMAKVTQNNNTIIVDHIITQVNTPTTNMNELTTSVTLNFMQPIDGTTINIPKETHTHKHLKN